MSKCICPDWEGFKAGFSEYDETLCPWGAEWRLIDAVELLWCFAKVGIRLTDWPGNSPASPDLNPIETIWALIKDRIQKSHGMANEYQRMKRSR